MLFNSSVYISRHPVRLADKNCDVSVITLYAARPVSSHTTYQLLKTPVKTPLMNRLHSYIILHVSTRKHKAHFQHAVAGTQNTQ